MYSQGQPSQNDQQQGQGQQPQMQPPLYYYPQARLQQPQQQQQQQYDYSQYHQHYQQQYQLYQGYQQYQQYQQHTQPQQTPLQSQLAAALAPISGLLGQSSKGGAASSLPPSYSTPLPPAKSKAYNNGSKKPYSSNNPLGQMQAQYQSSMQMGAAAASAATAALFAHGYAGNSAAGGAPSSGTSGAQEFGPEAAGSEWYSSYQTPTLEQRMAVTMASNGGPGGKPSHSRNSNKRPNNNNSKQNNRQGQNGNIKNNNQRGKQNQNQNQKHVASSSASTVEPEMESIGFHCDACDVTFHEEAKLKIHVAAHRTCPDCQYAASPSLVSEHRKLTHGPKAAEGASEDTAGNSKESAAMVASGSAVSRPNVRAPLPTTAQKAKKPFVQEPGLPKLPALDTPEDIANWIAQRRRAWPTESNIQKKELERQEMIAKGQIVEDNTPKDPRGRNKQNKNNKNNNNRNQKRGQPGDDTLTEDSSKKQKLDGDDPSQKATASEGVVTYSSSTEQSDNVDEDEDEDMDPVKDAISSKDPSAMGKISLPADRQRPKKPCRYFMRGRCGKGDKCTYSHDPSLKNKTQNANASANSNNKEVFRTRPSLLQMLLSSEIKQEKNMLLEAMRYMVENNFFDRQEPTGALVEEVAIESA